MAKKGKPTRLRPWSRPRSLVRRLEILTGRAAAKSRVIIVRLLSQAMTGFFYSFRRPRTSTPMSMMKYDPIGAFFLGAPCVRRPPGASPASNSEPARADLRSPETCALPGAEAKGEIDLSASIGFSTARTGRELGCGVKSLTRRHGHRPPVPTPRLRLKPCPRTNCTLCHDRLVEHGVDIMCLVWNIIIHHLVNCPHFLLFPVSPILAHLQV